MKTKIIWTMIKSSFMMMGGDPYYPGTTEIDIIETKKIKGIEFFSFKTASGKLKIAEGISGGILADSFEEIIENTKGCNKKFLLKQITDGGKQLLSHRKKNMSNDEFFSYYKF